MQRLILPLGAALLLCAVPAYPQGRVEETNNRYEAMYGRPVDVSIEDLVSNPSSYHRQAVRTHGRLELGGGRYRTYLLRGAFSSALRIEPVPDLAGALESQILYHTGREVEVAGVFIATSQSNVQEERNLIQFWEYTGPPDPDQKGEIKSAQATLQSLVGQPGKRDGQTIRVVGKFRGRNLYGDLPTSSQRRSDDWVIKDEEFAVWVTGRKPKGSGWELDTSLKRDTGKWIEVIGRPETSRGVTYLKAVRVSLTSPPTLSSEVAPPPPPPERPKVPPVVVFALPLDGESEVPTNSRFVVQFSKDMDEASFEGRIRLRYAGPRLPGDREFDGIKMTYDRGRRALTVDPGDILRPNREIELLLLPGIVDVDGMGLVPRTGRALVEGAEILHYRVVS